MAWSRDFVSGAYAVTWNSKNIGYSEEGFVWEIDTAEPVAITEDRHGMAEIDAVWQNIRAMFIRIESMYWNQEAWEAMLPTIAWAGGESSVKAGQLLVRGSKTQSLVLTPKTGPAVSAGGTYTFSETYPIINASFDFSARRNRRIPVVYQVFPTLDDDDDTKECNWFTRT